MLWQLIRSASSASYRHTSQSMNAFRLLTTQVNRTVVPDDSLVSQLVNTIMRHGKKARAQRLVSDSMKQLEQRMNTSEPYSVLAEAIESASPFMKVTTTKKHAKAIIVPVPLRERQRRRRAIVWILDALRKRNEKTFEERFSGEIADIMQGTSPVLEKKAQLHKQALANRANAHVSYGSMAR